MEEPFTIEVVSDAIPIAGDRPVVFHGINKSGSLAMFKVLHEAYIDADRAREFFSTYHGIPKAVPQLATIMNHSRGHAFYGGHYLYGAIEIPQAAVWVTQLRHPVQRTLSVHGWLKRGFLRKHGNLDGFPPLRKWVESRRGVLSSQMSQLAVGFGPRYDRRIRSMPPERMREQAITVLRERFVWFGIAECFEESIFALAHLCGLERVSPWAKDTRNRWREPLADIDEATLDFIRDSFAEEINFYDHAKALFLERVSKTDFGPSFAAYQARCAGEYGERVPSPATPRPD